MPKREFEKKANKLKELGDQGLLYKAQNPVSRNPAVTREYRQDMIKRTGISMDRITRSLEKN